MGLRFRKSISLCKGVKLNFGKTGASISVGGKGYRKTINTKGQVTTSFGIPGTGVYYTETTSLNKDKNNRSSNSSRTENNYRRNNQTDYMKQNSISSYQLEESADDYWDTNDIANIVQDSQIEISRAEVDPLENPSRVGTKVSISDILNLYTHCDETVDWTEIVISASADELFMEEDIWRFYKNVANKVLDGDIDTYLQVIEQIRPLDDLLSYGGDFEFGTDNPDVMEIEFNVMPEDVLGNGYNDELLQEYVCACSIRVARDIMALLPVNKVIVTAVLENRKLLEVGFDKAVMLGVNFKSGNTGSAIIKNFDIRYDG